MTGKYIRLAVCLVLLPALAFLGSGFALPGPDPPAPEPSSSADQAGIARDITMAEYLATGKDRLFDSSFSFRFVKRGNISYYVRFSSLYLCQGLAVKKLLDNAFIYWMFVDGAGNLWFCVGGTVDISVGELVERKTLYRYDRAKAQFSLVKEESADCTFCNRFYHSCFLYWERGYLKAYDTAGGGVYLLGSADNPAVFVSPDGEALYYSDTNEHMLKLTGLSKKQRKRTVLNPADFPLNVFTFDEYIIESGTTQLSYYRFLDSGYVKVCDFPPSSDGLYEDGIALFPTGSGICAIEEAYRARVGFYSFSTKAWSRIGNAEPVDLYGYGEGMCWFYTQTAPVRLYVFQGGREYEHSFGNHVDGCSSIRIAGARAYLFQYEEDWLTHVLLLDTDELLRISD